MNRRGFFKGVLGVALAAVVGRETQRDLPSPWGRPVTLRENKFQRVEWGTATFYAHRYKLSYLDLAARYGDAKHD